MKEQTDSETRSSSPRDSVTLHEADAEMPLTQKDAKVEIAVEKQQEPEEHLNIASHGAEEAAVGNTEAEREEVLAISEQGDLEQAKPHKKHERAEVVLQDRTFFL